MSKKTKKLIKAIALGDTKAISALNEEQDDDENSIPSEGVILAFFYLLENGRPEGGAEIDGPNYHDFTITEESQFEEMIRDWERYGNEFDHYSDESLETMIECMGCWEVLNRKGQLHLLDKYKSKLL